MRVDCPVETERQQRSTQFHNDVQALRTEHWISPLDEIVVNPLTNQVFVMRKGQVVGATDLLTIGFLGGHC